jgi:hypothetical protein
MTMEREREYDRDEDQTLGDIVGHDLVDEGGEGEEVPEKVKPEARPLTKAEREERVQRNKELAQLVTNLVIEPVVTGTFAGTGKFSNDELNERANRISNQAEARLTQVYTLADTAGMLGMLENLPMWARILVSVGGTGVIGVAAAIGARKDVAEATQKKPEVR